MSRRNKALTVIFMLCIFGLFFHEIFWGQGLPPLGITILFIVTAWRQAVKEAKKRKEKSSDNAKNRHGLYYSKCIFMLQSEQASTGAVWIYRLEGGRNE